MEKTKPKYSVVIPVLQAGAYIQASVERVVSVMEGQGEPWELILVDDKSYDNTWEVLIKLKPSYPMLRLFRLNSNRGQTPATQCGVLQAKGELIITLDDDMQHPPEEIPKLLYAYQQGGYAIIFGDPQKRQHPDSKHKLLVTVGKFVFHSVFMRRYRGINFFTTFRLFERRLLKEYDGPWGNLFYIWQLPALEARHIATEQHPRIKGRSNHTFWRLIRHFSPFLVYFLTVTMQTLTMVTLVLGIIWVVYRMLQGLPAFGGWIWPAFVWLISLNVVKLFATWWLSLKEQPACEFEEQV